MEKDIVNRVANSKLQTIDLEDFYPSGKRTALDIKQWLFQGIILKENEFRAFLKGHDWSQYKDQYVALNCSTDAIIPSWAFMLVSTYLNPYSKLVIVGDIPMLETAIFLKEALPESGSYCVFASNTSTDKRSQQFLTL